MVALNIVVLKLGKNTTAFYELLTAPASKILDRWFESEPLKAALATDSVIGAMISPHTPGSGSEVCICTLYHTKTNVRFLLASHISHFKVITN